MSKVHSHYENLKVARDAPLEVIRAAYRSLTQKYHPDRNPGDSGAVRIMQRINAAYEVLSDPEKRREHDAWIAAEEAKEAQSESSPDSTADHGFAESERQQQQSSLSGSPPHEPPRPDFINTKMPHETGVTSGMLWRRFWAKTVDISLVQVVTISCVVTISPHHLHPFLLMMGWLCVVFFVYDTLTLYFFETSLGRYLFGIECSPVGVRSLGNTAQRTVTLLIMGLGGFIPIISFITELYSYKRVRRSGEALWDVGKFEVFYGSGGIWKYLAAGGLVCILATFSNELASGFDVISQYGPSAYETPEQTAHRQYDYFQLFPSKESKQSIEQASQASVNWDDYTPVSPEQKPAIIDPFDLHAPSKEIIDLRNRAESGDAVAQYKLGVLYMQGKGVAKDYQEAIRWYRRSAAQGHTYGKNNLGMMYGEAWGVPRNRVVAYAIINLAAINDLTNIATRNRDILAELMTTQEITAAQALTEEMAKPGNLLTALDDYVARSH